MLTILVVNEEKKSMQVSLAQQGELTVTLPETFYTEKDPLSGEDDILALYNFYGRKDGITISGFFKTAILYAPLYSYLDDAAKTRAASIYDLNRTTVVADGVEGYQWSYKIKTGDDNYIIARDAFFSGRDRFYTLHFYTATTKNSVEALLSEKALDAVYNETLNSIQFSDSIQSGKLLEWYS
jgi:hypothetical protein